ncbi:hypothetical protein F941_00771 [Acinetobacter bouvetii DSM 14964 = CIP 107468]|uniref:Uncharacterized protein n=1 Tax=Acinetobacter bouvetii DSM 14964 = CIP 107468 TaxID=1120925 RepID=N9DSU7_9GAMM|nr:hypothetical protein F941_00771 [Acinetobacter bouvetii DSM 14964 = CIP 107468]
MICEYSSSVSHFSLDKLLMQKDQIDSSQICTAVIWSALVNTVKQSGLDYNFRLWRIQKM